MRYKRIISLVSVLLVLVTIYISYNIHLAHSSKFTVSHQNTVQNGYFLQYWNTKKEIKGDYAYVYAILGRSSLGIWSVPVNEGGTSDLFLTFKGSELVEAKVLFNYYYFDLEGTATLDGDSIRDIRLQSIKGNDGFDFVKYSINRIEIQDAEEGDVEAEFKFLFENQEELRNFPLR